MCSWIGTAELDRSLRLDPLQKTFAERVLSSFGDWLAALVAWVKIGRGSP